MLYDLDNVFKAFQYFLEKGKRFNGKYFGRIRMILVICKELLVYINHVKLLTEIGPLLNFFFWYLPQIKFKQILFHFKSYIFL